MHPSTQKTPQRQKLLQINNKCLKQMLIEVLSRIAVRTGMIWRPSSYVKLVQPTTQPKQTNPQTNPNATLLRVIIVNIYTYRAAQDVRPSRWVSKS